MAQQFDEKNNPVGLDGVEGPGRVWAVLAPDLEGQIQIGHENCSIGLVRALAAGVHTVVCCALWFTRPSSSFTCSSGRRGGRFRR